MNLADKLIELRKKTGMSQEELADRIGVTRQAVSKWEGMQSTPDLNNIVSLSKLFGVSTDYLLNDEKEMSAEKRAESNADNKAESKLARKKVRLSTASEYIDIKFKTAKLIATGVLLCILSPIALFFCGILSENYVEHELLICMIGLIVMLCFVAVAVVLFVISGFKTNEFAFLTNEVFEIENGVSEMVNSKKNQIRNSYNIMTTVGIVILILSVIPLFVGMAIDNDLIAVSGLSVTLALCSIGIFLMVYSGCKMGALTRLLQNGDYSERSKKNSTLINAFSSCYWGVTTIVYLTWSFVSNDWHITWIVWVVAGILSAVIFPFINILLKNQDR